MKPFDAIIISDLHLGSDVSQTGLLHCFLNRICVGDMPTKDLIINGDVFDSMNLNRLHKGHWQIVSDIRSLTDHVNVIVNMGNHDGDLDNLANLTGFKLTDEYVFVSGGKRMLAFHGDKYDEFITRHPIITSIADFGYGWLQKIDKSFYTARQAKRASKTFLRCSNIIETRAIEYAKKQECSVVFCGHTHMEIYHPGEISYYNSGCWTELPCSYIVVRDGNVELRKFDDTSL